MLVLYFFLTRFLLTSFHISYVVSTLFIQLNEREKYKGLSLSRVSARIQMLIETLRNGTAGRLRKVYRRKKIAQDRDGHGSRDILSSFCRPESCSRSKKIKKLTFRALAFRQSKGRRANARNVSFLNLSRW